VPAQITVSGIQRVLQLLLAERISIRDLATILEGIADAISFTRNPAVLVEHVRGRLSRQICAQYTSAAGYLPLIALSAKWEQAFAESLVGAGEERSLAMQPSKLSEFMAAVLSNGGGFYQPFAYVAEAMRMGLTVLPPDINASDFRCSGKGREIRIGLQYINGLSADAVQRVFAAHDLLAGEPEDEIFKEEEPPPPSPETALRYEGEAWFRVGGRLERRSLVRPRGAGATRDEGPDPRPAAGRGAPETSCHVRPPFRRL